LKLAKDMNNTSNGVQTIPKTEQRGFYKTLELSLDICRTTWAMADLATLHYYVATNGEYNNDNVEGTEKVTPVLTTNIV
jgi:hypothetical protein